MTSIMWSEIAKSVEDAINNITIAKDINFEGENDMENKVLELWYKRKVEKIDKEFDERIKKFINEHKIIKEYNDIISECKTKLLELYERKENEGYVRKNGYEIGVEGYCIDRCICDEMTEGIRKERDNIKRELIELKEEIYAQLSLSDDKDYQVEVLTRYNILDKKGKLNID